MDLNTKEYIDLYNKLDNHLDKILGTNSHGEKYVGYKEKLDKIRNSRHLSESSIIRNHFDNFTSIGYLRNEIVHRYFNKISIKEEALNDLKKYLNILQHPTKARELFEVDVYRCQLNDSLPKIIKDMKNNVFTHVPVYDGEQFVEVLTESTIVYGIGKYIDNNGDLILENIKIKDILKENPNDRYEFISQNINIYEIKNKFEDSIKEGKRLGALLMTNLGKKTEPLLGIITAWDLPRIDEIINSKQ